MKEAGLRDRSPVQTGDTSNIEFRGVEKVFPTTSRTSEIVALGGVDLTIRAGEIFVLLGPSGCGKTTLLNLLAGFAKPTRGTVAVGGKIVTGPSPDRIVVFQQPTLYPWLTVSENIGFGPELRGISASQVKADVHEFTQATGLEKFARAYPYELSGGMQQRVALARALINRPRVLLMDEPFTALDAQLKIHMQELFMGVWLRFKTTTLFITHDVEEAIFLGDRVGVMTGRPGRLRQVFAVDLPRPRVIEVSTQPYFVGLKRDILSILREEGAL